MNSDEIAGVGKFAYAGSYPLGEGGPIVGHIYTDVEKLTPAGVSLLEHAANKIHGIEVHGPVGRESHELRVQYAAGVDAEETLLKRVCLAFIAEFRKACENHQRTIGSEPIVCQRVSNEDTLMDMKRVDSGLKLFR